MRKKLATELRKLGTEAEFVRTDVRHEEEVKDLVDKTIARFGRLDIAVNNAGTVGKPGSAADVTTEAYQSIFDTNVLGVLLCMKYEIRAMLHHFAQTQENKANFLETQVPNKRIGTPEEIANAIVFISSDKASYIIGIPGGRRRNDRRLRSSTGKA